MRPGNLVSLVLAVVLHGACGKSISGRSDVGHGSFEYLTKVRQPHLQSIASSHRMVAVLLRGRQGLVRVQVQRKRDRQGLHFRAVHGRGVGRGHGGTGGFDRAIYFASLVPNSCVLQSCEKQLASRERGQMVHELTSARCGHKVQRGAGQSA